MARFELQKLYIDGGYSDASSDATFEAINPANGEVLANVQRATKEDVERAVVSAEKGQKIWAAMTAMERSRILRRAVDILRERNDELAALETLDTGKSFSETKYVDIVTGADVLEYYAGLVPAIEGEQIPLRTTSFVYTRREPLGVVAGIGAWNYPIQIALWKSAPALAAGNAMIFKPSEVTSLTTLKLAEIYTEAGVPAGVFNVLTGSGREVGTWLTEHPRIEKVSFTGFVGALHDALAADVDPAASGHLAVHGQALGVEFVEVFPAGPVRHQVGVGDQYARGIAVGLEYADGFAGLHQQGFVVVEVGQAFDDLVVALPVARGPADAAVHHQLFRVLGHLWVEVVHQHAQRRFSQPAFGGELVATGSADFNVTVLGRLGHKKFLNDQCANMIGAKRMFMDSYAHIFTCTYKHMQSSGQLG